MAGSFRETSHSPDVSESIIPQNRHRRNKRDKRDDTSSDDALFEESNSTLRIFLLRRW